MSQTILSFTPPRNVITFTVFDELVKFEPDGAEVCQTWIRWSFGHAGSSYGEQSMVPPNHALGYALCQALYRAQEKMASVGVADPFPST